MALADALLSFAIGFTMTAWALAAWIAAAELRRLRKVVQSWTASGDDRREQQ